MISHQPLPASIYNSLPLADDQSSIPNNALMKLGQIIVSHGMQNHLGIGLLHRHYDLDSGELMVHEGLKCSPKSADDSTAFGGSSFYLSENEFRAFEYDMERPIDPPAAFLSEMASCLRDDGLNQKMTLSKLDLEHALLEETCDDETRSHVCTELAGPNPNYSEEATVWKFGVSQEGKSIQSWLVFARKQPLVLTREPNKGNAYAFVIF